MAYSRIIRTYGWIFHAFAKCEKFIFGPGVVNTRLSSVNLKFPLSPLVCFMRANDEAFVG